MTPKPSIGVAGDQFPAPLIRLLGEAGHWCHVLALTADVTEPVDAVVARLPELLAAPAVVRAAPRRTAVWVDTVGQVDDPLLVGTDVVLSDQPAVLESLGGRGLFTPAGSEAPPGRWVAPHVRSRIRAAGGLASHVIVEQHGSGWCAWPDGRRLEAGLADTALACASAAVA